MSTGDLNDLFLIVAGRHARADPGRPARTRVRVPVVVAELAGGILIGPYGLNWATENPLVVFLSAFGLAMLFFMAGMELDFVRVRGRPLTLGVAGWLFSLGLGIAIAAGLQASGFILSAKFVGVALSTTAIGTLLPVLRDRGELGTHFGTLVMGAGVAGEFGPIVMISLLFGNSADRSVTTALFGRLHADRAGRRAAGDAGAAAPSRAAGRGDDGGVRPAGGARGDRDPDRPRVPG